MNKKQTDEEIEDYFILGSNINDLLCMIENYIFDLKYDKNKVITPEIMLTIEKGKTDKGLEKICLNFFTNITIDRKHQIKRIKSGPGITEIGRRDLSLF